MSICANDPGVRTPPACRARSLDQYQKPLPEKVLGNRIALDGPHASGVLRLHSRSESKPLPEKSGFGRCTPEACVPKTIAVALQKKKAECNRIRPFQSHRRIL
jgi:hypothetical protein